MAVPRAVQRQAEAAEKAFEKQKAEDLKAQEEQAPVVIDPPVVKAAEPVKENWEERFKGYKASSDKTIHDLRTQNAELAQGQQTLSSQLQELTQKMERKPVNELTVEESFNEEERQTYDDNYQKMLLRIAKMQAERVTDGFKTGIEERLSKIEGNVSRVAQTQTRSAVQVYEDALDASVPEWVEIGQEDNFKTWLGNNRVSPLDRRTYGHAMTEAHAALDSQSVIYILKEYQQQSKGKKPSLEGQLTPTGAGGGEVAEEGRIYRESEIKQYYTDCTRKKYTKQQMVDIDQEINEAAKAGRIRPG